MSRRDTLFPAGPPTPTSVTGSVPVPADLGEPLPTGSRIYQQVTTASPDVLSVIDVESSVTVWAARPQIGMVGLTDV